MGISFQSHSPSFPSKPVAPQFSGLKDTLKAHLVSALTPTPFQPMVVSQREFQAAWAYMTAHPEPRQHDTNSHQYVFGMRDHGSRMQVNVFSHYLAKRDPAASNQQFVFDKKGMLIATNATNPYQPGKQSDLPLALETFFNHALYVKSEPEAAALKLTPVAGDRRAQIAEAFHNPVGAFFARVFNL